VAGEFGEWLETLKNDWWVEVDIWAWLWGLQWRGNDGGWLGIVEEDVGALLGIVEDGWGQMQVGYDIAAWRALESIAAMVWEDGCGRW
jgi:hypothetical protein